MNAAFRRFILMTLAWVVVLPSAAYGHRLDEYLQATLVEIEPDGVRLHVNLTPGADVAGQLLFLLDRDRDGAISVEESAAYAEVVKHDLQVAVDGRDVDLAAVRSHLLNPGELNDGGAILQIEYAAQTPMWACGLHRVVVENRHLPELGVYLINAAMPTTTSIQIERQLRNVNQSRGEIEFTVVSIAGKALVEADSSSAAITSPPAVLPELSSSSSAPRVGGLAAALATLLVAAYALNRRRGRGALTRLDLHGPVLLDAIPRQGA